MDAVNIVIIPNELLLFSDHYNLQVFQSLFRMVFCSKNLFLGNQNFEESQFENNKQLNKKIYLRLLYSVYGKKINSNSILQNLKFLKLHNAILNAFQNEVMQMTAQTQRDFFNNK